MRRLGRAFAFALILSACLPAKAHGYGSVARITWYDQGYVTASGYPVGPGVAACSWNFPLYTRIRIAGLYDVVCLDRGDLGWSNWIDVWDGWWLPGAVGDYADIEVMD